MNNFLKLLFSISLCQLAGVLGSYLTMPAIPGWYEGLKKPALTPPGWVIGVVWTILYALMGLAAYLVWSKGLEQRKVRIALGLFLVQLVLNFLWSFLFFGLKTPFYALLEIMILWVFILITIVKFYPISKPAGLLLLPYIFWVSFATLLNFLIVRLN